MSSIAQLSSPVPVANPEAYIPNGEYNPHNVRPFVISNEYGDLAVAYASCDQDALDEACDAGLLNGLAVDAADVDWETLEDVMLLGNAGEPFDSVNAGCRTFPNVEPGFFA